MPADLARGGCTALRHHDGSSDVFEVVGSCEVSVEGLGLGYPLQAVVPRTFEIPVGFI